jgi:hypothetical protein
MVFAPICAPSFLFLVNSAPRPRGRFFCKSPLEIYRVHVRKLGRGVHFVHVGELDALARWQCLLRLFLSVFPCPRNTTRACAGWWANFPQAFSHLALVSSASNFVHYRKPAEQCSAHAVDD